MVEFIQSLGAEPFRAAQIMHAVDKGMAGSWDEIHVLPGKLRKKLGEIMPLLGSTVTRTIESRDGTVKLEILLHDSQVIESAVIPSGGRRTLCISTQAGCPVGCEFCASGASGFKRNLEPHEIFEQGIHANMLSGKRGGFTHLVAMGIGEPMLNLENLLEALERFRNGKGFSIGARRMVISTVGIIEGIERLSAHVPHVNLAVSLHTPFQEQRNELVPWARKYGIRDIINAALGYQRKTGRQVTFEYVLIRETNTSGDHASRLGDLLKGKGFHVNLIPYNDTGKDGLLPPRPRETTLFAETLRKYKVSVTLRKSKGSDAFAACGQLRLKSLTT